MASSRRSASSALATVEPDADTEPKHYNVGSPAACRPWARPPALTWRCKQSTATTQPSGALARCASTVTHGPALSNRLGVTAAMNVQDAEPPASFGWPVSSSAWKAASFRMAQSSANHAKSTATLTSTLAGVFGKAANALFASQSASGSGMSWSAPTQISKRGSVPAIELVTGAAKFKLKRNVVSERWLILNCVSGALMPSEPPEQRKEQNLCLSCDMNVPITVPSKPQGGTHQWHSWSWMSSADIGANILKNIGLKSIE